jgi:hypothetical protein
VTAGDRQPMLAIGSERRIEIEPVANGHVWSPSSN